MARTAAQIHPAAPKLIELRQSGAMNIDIFPQLGMERSHFYRVLSELRAEGLLPAGRPTGPRKSRPRRKPEVKASTTKAAADAPARAPAAEREPVAPPRRAEVPRYTPPITGPAKTCTFPLWGHRQRPDHRFCAAPSIPGHSWCDQHCAVVFVAQKAAA